MKFIITCFLLTLLAGCSNFPYMPDVEQGTPINTAEFKKIHTGDDEQAIIATVGQPSFKHVFHDNQWYYMIDNKAYKQPLVYKLVFQDHILKTIKPNQSV